MTQRATPSPDIFESSVPRFTRLLLTEDDEYLFSDVNCHLLHAKPQLKIPGQLKICSFNLYWVPRDNRQPIIRIPYKTTTSPSLLAPPPQHHHDHHHCITLTSMKVTELQLRDLPAPYIQVENPPPFHFSLVFARVEDILEEIQLLWSLATQQSSSSNSNNGHMDRAAVMAARKELIDKHEAAWNASFSLEWLEDTETLLLESPVASITHCVNSQGGLDSQRGE